MIKRIVLCMILCTLALSGCNGSEDKEHTGYEAPLSSNDAVSAENPAERMEVSTVPRRDNPHIRDWEMPIGFAATDWEAGPCAWISETGLLATFIKKEGAGAGKINLVLYSFTDNTETVVGTLDAGTPIGPIQVSGDVLYLGGSLFSSRSYKALSDAPLVKARNDSLSEMELNFTQGYFAAMQGENSLVIGKIEDPENLFLVDKNASDGSYVIQPEGWSPDGRLLAYRKVYRAADAPSELCIVDIAGEPLAKMKLEDTFLQHYWSMDNIHLLIQNEPEPRKYTAALCSVFDENDWLRMSMPFTGTPFQIRSLFGGKVAAWTKDETGQYSACVWDMSIDSVSVLAEKLNREPQMAYNLNGHLAVVADEKLIVHVNVVS